MIGFLNALPGAAAQGIMWGIMAIGVYITYKILDVADLTVDGSFATGAAVLVVSMTGGVSLPVAMILAFVAGSITGLVTGLLHTKMGIPFILAGILTQLGLYSVNLGIMGKANMTLSNRNYQLLVNRKEVYSSLVISIIFAAVIIALLYWFFGTSMGHALRATGCNLAMARANGINTNTSQVIAIIISNGLVALSGALTAQWQGSADVGMGRGAIVIGLAAVIIGEVIFGKIFKNFALRLTGVILGGIIYYVVITVVLNLGFDANYLKLLSAVVVAIFLAIPYWKKRWIETRIKEVKEVEEDAAD